jgi:2-phospho-L-lactate/phosphoenolpyruvate guanylyltransferase
MAVRPYLPSVPQRLIQVVVPFKQNGAKSRLSPVLTPQERRSLAFAMLRDVLDAVSGQCPATIPATILSRPGLDIVDVGRKARIWESDLELNDAINAYLKNHAGSGWPTDILIVMADLALLTEREVARVLNCEGDVVLCPGRGGGTNMILARSPSFRTCYRGLSFPKHLNAAKELGLKVSIFDSFRASCDIDDPSDLAELMMHSRGSAAMVLNNFKVNLNALGRAVAKKIE